VNVLFIIYRRPDVTARAFAAIAAARPSHLYIAADGPRDDAEHTLCEAARRIVSHVTWPCEVARDYADRNLGCRARVSSALDWFFGACESGIVLEDDCLASPDFFWFCEELLERYRDDERVVHISGETYRRQRGSEYSYYFSKYALTWGWASWRRSWRAYDLQMRSWPDFRRQPEAAALYDTADEASYWDGVFQQMYEGRLATWDYAWHYACMTQGLSIHPAVNLVENVGSGSGGTNTVGDHPGLHRRAGTLERPLRHPAWAVRDRQADLDLFDDRLVGAILKRQRSLRHQVGRPGRWLSRALRGGS